MHRRLLEERARLVLRAGEGLRVAVEEELDFLLQPRLLSLVVAVELRRERLDL